MNTERTEWALTLDEIKEAQEWIDRFKERPINFFRKRIYLLLGSDIFSDAKFQNLCHANGISDVSELLTQFMRALEQFDPLFTTVPDDHTRFKDENALFSDFVRMFAFAEARNFDKRAIVLQKFHPLGLQIHVATGTANGVLVVRTDAQCRQLLEAILMNEAKFRIAQEDWGTALVESISDSRFRVVTKHPVLTAAFWNFFEPTRTVRPTASRQAD